MTIGEEELNHTQQPTGSAHHIQRHEVEHFAYGRKGGSSPRKSIIDASSTGDGSILWCTHCHQAIQGNRSPKVSSRSTFETWRNVQHNVRMMDHMHDARFGSWIKSEEHAATATNHLRRLIDQYPPERIANGLRWLFIDWRLGTIACVLGDLFFSIPTPPTTKQMECILEILQQITFDWRREHVSELIRLLAQDQDSLKEILERRLFSIDP